MESNRVSITITPSKEFIPIWKITGEILHDVLDDVMSRIAKKKAPQKKTKANIIKKPTHKVKEGRLLISF